MIAIRIVFAPKRQFATEASSTNHVECVQELMAEADKRRAAERELQRRQKAWANLKAIFDKARGAGMKSPPDPGLEPKLEDILVEMERERLFDILRELVNWENSNNERVLNQTRAEIMRSCNGKPPPGKGVKL